MKGDFSNWDSEGRKNFSGVLHQQGRVLLDTDWNAQTRITGSWQDQAGRDAIGPGVAAIPASDSDGFKVVKAEVVGGKIKVGVLPGRAWADGLLTYLDGEAAVSRMATYLKTPESPVSPGVRDAVILEVWREAVNGFQMPEELIEPALGGPDTTERLHTSMAFRLLRLKKGDACGNIGGKLKDDLSKKGRLKVTLQPVEESDEECPMIEGGGYTGFEHCLYRIEMAPVKNGSPPMFKWSQFNGGLVGRGKFDASEKKLTLTANMQAIITSGLDSCYLEAVEYNEELGHWEVTYGAKVTLNSDNEIELPDPGNETFGSIPSSGGGLSQAVFFRLWNGIELVSDFPEAAPSSQPNELRDGIRLEFSPFGLSEWLPGDYWTFKVRAGEKNPQVLMEKKPPEGIRYHRVVLAELHWAGALSLADDEIEDCRRIFRPLTKQKICCSYTVGHEADFKTIQEAVDKLPWWGGEICLLPGIHRASVKLHEKFNIRFKGCGLRTLVLPAVTGEPIFKITNSWFVAMEHMWLASFGGTVIEMAGGGWNEIGHNSIFAYRHALHVFPWVHIVNGTQRSQNPFHYHIHNNVIRMLDRPGGDVAIHFVAEEGLIERNNIAVLPAGTRPAATGVTEEQPEPSDECAEPESFEADTQFVHAYLTDMWRVDLSSLSLLNPFNALGGIQLGGNSWRVKVRDNKIFGGDGNGITLGTGSLIPVSEETETAAPSSQHVINVGFPYVMGTVQLNGKGQEGITVKFTGPGTFADVTDKDGYFGFAEEVPQGKYAVTVETPGYEIEKIGFSPFVFGSTRPILIGVREVEIAPEASDPFAFLYEIEIAGNKISQVGLCGIGFPVFISRRQAASTAFAVSANIHAQMGNPVIGLSITGNHIRNCLQHASAAISFFGRSRGLGGISLGMCEDLTIRENRIEDNGRDHRDPVCGIFAAYAAQADISDNHLINNSPLNAKADTNVLPGIRGGIVLRKVLSITLAGVAKTIRPAAPSATEHMGPVLANAVRAAAALGGYAVRIHDNLVKQPVGQALHIFALGPVSVANNQLVTDFMEPRQRRALAGSVFITNYGQPHHIRRFMNVPLPSGSVIFSNNRIRLSVADCWTSQTIISADDVAYLGNHSDVMEEARPILFNTMIGALTLRATENRLQEVIGPAAFADLIYDVSGIEPPGGGSLNGSHELKASLFSYAVLMNNTAHNQGNHCLLALSVVGEPVDSDNQALVVPMEVCKSYQAWLNKYARVLLPGFLKLGGLST